jgi:hypothetical protein
VLAQLLRLPHSVHAHHEPELARPPGRHPDQRVLEDGGVRRIDAEHPRRLQVGIGRGLAVQPALGRDLGVDADVELVGHAAGLEHGLGIGAGRDDGGLEARLADGREVVTRAGVDLDPVALEHLEHQLVLPVAKALHGGRAGRVGGRPLRKLDPSRFEERLRAVEPRLAVDVLVIVMDRVERYECLAVAGGPDAQELVEHLFPGGGVHHRRLGHHPVHVEQAGGDVVRQP